MMSRKSPFVTGIGLVAVAIALISMASESAGDDLRGNEPVIYETMWGQNVMPDFGTLLTMEVYKRLEPGQPWSAGAAIKKKLRGEYKTESLKVHSFPVCLDEGLYVLGHNEFHQLIYLLDTGDGLLLIDPSYESLDDVIVSQIEELRYDPGNVRWVMLTHCHVDHAQSCHLWRQRGAEIIVPLGDDHPVETGNQITAWWLVPEPHRHFTGCPVDRVIHDGDRLDFGEITIYSIHTPGHTPGSTCYYLDLNGKRILISGDVALHNGRHAWMGHPYADWDQYLKSLRKLASYTLNGERIRYQYLLPGHGVVEVEDGQRSVEETIRVVANIVVRRESGENIDRLEPYSWNWKQGITYR